ncbi:helix-turn-helix domain-containing protein [Butyrivibrio proteoclasticus]|uniref:helix-turn-helix domain-containing protein n=1 Tax=Butyrivibrio proteoclasticus TaxID=43305 RepID=UPI00068720B2|nr:helix-turn-helix transcriptional regulator [Butyrivibrio proteoclasticus]
MYAYNQMYLDDAMHNLAEALEAAKLRLNITLDSFMHMFICSGIASQFEIGNPKYVSGMSGTELVNEVLLKTYGSDADTLGNCKYSDPTPEYWTGWVLAYYQWFSGKTFKDIQKAMPIEELVDKYHPFHEGDETLVVEYIDRRFLEQSQINRLKAYRKLIGLSQSELAKASDVNLRTLQQYEIGAKDIKKASTATVIALSKALKCSVEDLVN